MAKLVLRFTFSETSEQSQKEKEIELAERKAHAARVSHARRRRNSAKALSATVSVFGSKLTRTGLQDTKTVGVNASSIVRRDGSQNLYHDLSKASHFPRTKSAEHSLWIDNPAQGTLDPFHVSRTILTPKMQFYFQHFDNTLFSPHGQRSRLQSIFSNTWGSVTTIDPAVLCTFIAISATSVGILHFGTSIIAPLEFSTSESCISASDPMMYRTKAIQLITERLSRAEDAVSDPLIAAVSIIVMLETIVGQSSYVVAHKTGLKKMVAARGGLQNLPLGLVRRVVTGDVKCSSSTLTVPDFEFDCPPLPGAPVSDYFTTSPLLWKISVVSPPDLNQVLCDLVLLTHIGWTKNFDALSVRKCIYLEPAGLQCLHIERRLLCWNNDASFEAHDNIASCCQLSGLLFISTALWPNFHPASYILRSLSGRLRHALNVATIKAFYASCPELLLWVTFIGYFACEAQDTAAFFVHHFGQVIALLKFSDIAQVNDTFQLFLYIPEIYDAASMRLWMRATQAPIPDC